MAMSKLGAFAAGAVVALVLGSGTAVAATGGKLILGSSNSATSTTRISNSKGTALSLTSKPGTPSLTVSNSQKVPSLNADSVDGHDSTYFARTAGRTGSISALGEPQDVDDPADGVNDFVFALAECPAGTQLTGGGYDDGTDTGVVVESAPEPQTGVDNSWFVAIAIDGTTEKNADQAKAYATCYNPQGAVPGAQVAASAVAAQLDAMSPRLVQHLETKADALQK